MRVSRKLNGVAVLYAGRRFLDAGTELGDNRICRVG